MYSIIGMIILGLFAGIFSGLFGVGGGVIIVPSLLYFFSKEAHVAIGTSLAIIIPTALVGVIKHYSCGNVDIKSFVLVSVGAIFGAYFGTILCNYLPGVILKRIFGIIIIVVGMKMVFFK